MPYCCDKCFNDEHLKNIIQESGIPGHCDYCNSDSQYCIEPIKLQETFLPLVNLYEGVTNFMPGEELSRFQGDHLWDKLNNDWEIFSFYESEKQEELVKEILSSTDPRDPCVFTLIDDFVEIPGEYWGDLEGHWSSLNEEWNFFCNEIKFKNRFHPDHGVQIATLLDQVLVYFVKKVKKDEVIYRARISKNHKKLLPSDMGRPSDASQCKAGRGNPAGVSYLYLSSNEDTALAEVKPYIGEYVTIGNFIVLRDLSIINLADPNIGSPFKHGDKIEHLLYNIYFLQMLSKELSKPLRPEEFYLDYLPTQYLCELIKSKQYKGIKFMSSVADGRNYLLYGDEDVICKETELYQVAGVSYKKKKLP